MSEQLVECTQCGKDVPDSLEVCPECGARNYAGRPSRRRPKPGAATRADDALTAVTDAVSSVPRAVREKARRGGAGKRKNRHSRSSSRSSNSSASAAHARESARDAEKPEDARRVSRRKIYRYTSQTTRKKTAFGTELRAIVLVVIIGLVLILMAHLQVITGRETKRDRNGRRGHAPALTMPLPPPAYVHLTPAPVLPEEKTSRRFAEAKESGARAAYCIACGAGWSVRDTGSLPQQPCPVQLRQLA